MVVLIKGKQKRVPRPPTIDGLPVDEFLLRNADPLWLHQNEMWESIDDGDRSHSVRGHHFPPPSRSRPWGAVKSNVGPFGTMPFGLICLWLP